MVIQLLFFIYFFQKGSLLLHLNLVGFNLNLNPLYVVVSFHKMSTLVWKISYRYKHINWKLTYLLKTSQANRPL